MTGEERLYNHGMNTFKRAEICGVALFCLFLPALACAQAALGGCMEETTVRIAGRDQVMTLQEAERIRQTVVKYLEEEKPTLEPSVFGPSEAFINCEGSVRMGAWILEPVSTEAPHLLLTFRVLTNEHFIVRQAITLALEEDEWKVTGVDRITTHLRY